jgi:hypothetical protein
MRVNRRPINDFFIKLSLARGTNVDRGNYNKAAHPEFSVVLAGEFGLWQRVG